MGSLGWRSSMTCSGSTRSLRWWMPRSGISVAVLSGHSSLATESEDPAAAGRGGPAVNPTRPPFCVADMASGHRCARSEDAMRTGGSPTAAIRRSRAVSNVGWRRTRASLRNLPYAGDDGVAGLLVAGKVLYRSALPRCDHENQRNREAAVHDTLESLVVTYLQPRDQEVE